MDEGEGITIKNKNKNKNKKHPMQNVGWAGGCTVILDVWALLLSSLVAVPFLTVLMVTPALLS
jgi:hypothetical protein